MRRLSRLPRAVGPIPCCAPWLALALAACQPSTGGSAARAPVDAGATADAAPAETPPAEAPPAEVLPPLPADGPPADYTYAVVERFPHDRAAFTQGLVVAGGALYESTGLHGASSVRRVDLATGAILARHDLADRYFGEGLAAVGDHLIQLTWRAGVAFVYDRATLAPVAEHRYAGQGWGLTHDGHRLILSDGTDRLRFFDPGDFSAQGSVAVTDQGRPVRNLNELEFVDGEVLANVWLTDTIVRIDPHTGAVRGRVDLSGLRPADVTGRDDVLNGIAWDPTHRRLLVTGKRWSAVFAIRIVPR